MGKAKPVTTSKAKAKASSKGPETEAAVEEAEVQPTAEQIEARRIYTQRRDATKWAKEKIDVVHAQVQESKKKGLSFDWLSMAHDFHEVRLTRFVKRLDEKTLDGVLDSLREGLEAYLTQCASGPDVDKDGFDYHRTIWDGVLQDGSAYSRKPETPESAAAIEKLKTWTVAKEADVTALVGEMATHSASAGVQEAGLTKIGGLFSQQREGADMTGMTCEALMPAIERGMREHMVDPGVQRSGQAALRGLSMAPGQLGLMRDAKGIDLAVESLLAQYQDKEVCQAANGNFSAMAHAAGKNSPELATMRAAGVVEALCKVMGHHAWDQTLCGKIRVTLPFIQED